MENLVLSAVIKVVIEKAGSSLVRQIGEMWDVDDHRKRLQDKLRLLQAVLADAFAQSTTCPAVKIFLTKVKSSAYDADNVIDEFRYEKLRQDAVKAGQKSANSNRFFAVVNRVVFCSRMCTKLKKVVLEIDDLVTDMAKFKFIQGVPEPATNRPDNCSFLEAVEVVGRDEEKEKIIGLLLDNSRTDNVTILPILGMGGLGKTALAVLVYDDPRIETHFEMKLWVCVSDQFNVCALAKSIIDLAIQRDCKLPRDNMPLLRDRLRKELSKRTYLIVLDDVWNEVASKWEQLQTLLGYSRPGTAIIVTTRSKKVADMMRTKDTFILTSLRSIDMLTLFKRRAFGKGVEECEELVKIGEKLLERCCGSPLAAKSLGALMSSKNDVSEWNEILNRKESWGNTTDEDGVIDVLRLSYDHLSPPYMKQCFAFCGLYPKDYKMDKNELIQMWIANGFIPNDDTTNIEHKGNEIFNKLAWGLFFQDIKQTHWYYISRQYGYLGITSFKMHDLIHDLAKSVSGNQNMTLRHSAENKELSEDVHNLLVTGCQQLDMDEVSRNFPNMRTLLLQSVQDKEFLCRSSKSNSLRVFQFSRCKNRIDLNFMKHLRYLDLKFGRFTKLSESITTLYNLETLDLTHCFKLTQLPFGTSYMISLKHLYIHGCNQLKCMPPGLRNLSGLKTLTKYIVTNEARCGLGEIRRLNLSGTLELSNLKVVRDPIDAREADLQSKSEINILKLNWSIVDEDCVPHGNTKEVMEALKPSNALKVLEVEQYCDAEFPRWMSDCNLLNNLIELYVEDCKVKSLPSIWQLPSLEVLELRDMSNLTYFYEYSSMNNRVDDVPIIFPALKSLILQNLIALEKWEKDNGNKVKVLIFPELRHLEILSCPELLRIPDIPLIKSLTVDNHRMKFSSVTHLTTLCDLTLYSIDPLLENKVVTTFRPWASLERLKMVVVDDMIPPDDDVIFEPSLRDLDIKFCNCFFSTRVSQLHMKLWENFIFLENLKLDNCPIVVLWPVEEFRRLKVLKRLDIKYFPNLTGSSPDTQLATTVNQDVLPRLQYLNFSNCPSLVEIPRCDTLSLRELRLSKCNKLTLLLTTFDQLDKLSIYDMEWESIPLNLDCLVSLKSLTISHCEKLMSLPDTMIALTSLRDLEISNCYKILFPIELHRPFQGLEELVISDCPNLERNFQKVGEYTKMVFSIPIVKINNNKIDVNSLTQGSTVNRIIGSIVPACVSSCSSRPSNE